MGDATKRAAVFAHFDFLGRIEDYVVYYLKELKKVADRIIFVSDSDISSVELAKIKDIVEFSITERHGEYDFGSYKRGYFYLRDKEFLDEADELIFANDSCFGPVFSFEKVFNKMQNSAADFWGMNLNDIDVTPHIQSFFVVFKGQVFKSERFNDFIGSIRQEKNKDDVIRKYEIGMSKTLVESGFKMANFIFGPIDREISYKLLFKRTNPLIKTCALDGAYRFFINEMLKGSKYPKDLILKSERYLNTKKGLLKNLNFIKKTIVKIRFNKREAEFFGRKFRF